MVGCVRQVQQNAMMGMELMIDLGSDSNDVNSGR